MIELFAIVNLNKARYNNKGFNPALDGDKPRLLVVRCIPKYKQYILKYPNGKTFSANEIDIIPRSVFNPDHMSYARVAKEVRAVEIEYKQNPTYQSFLTNRHPQLALDLAQSIEAKYQHKQQLKELDHQEAQCVHIEPPSLSTQPAPTTEELIYNVLLGVHEVLYKILRRLDE